MRDIKFRGKSKLTGEWVYGYYEYAEINKTNLIVHWGKDQFICSEVELDTVGQYTGLKDKNGKEIYEGDIVDWEDGRGEVYFRDGQFVHQFYEKINNYEVFRPSKRMWDVVEVIGNKYENPELLGDNR